VIQLRRATVVAFRLIVITGRHIRAARALLGWSQGELSKRSKVALRTVRRMEGFDGAVNARTETLNKVVAVLDKAGVEFLNGGKAGVRLR
jgi:predicted transcriptional regulator